MEKKINWFPGHMKSALDMIGGELRLCDCVIYLLDARCPRSCVNPKFEEFVQRKPVLFVLNKADLARGGKFEFGHSLTINSTLSGAGKKVVCAVEELLSDKIEAALQKGIAKTVRACVIGVTNCGKSTFINNLAGSGKALTGDKPGVTKTKQWVPVDLGKHGGASGGRRLGGFWLLDTPGVLWPSFESEQVARNLAYVGSIKDDILNIIELSKHLIEDLKRLDAGCILGRFGADDFEGICRRRGYVLRGGVFDEERAAKAILTEFRAGKIGKFNLDELL